MTAATKAVFKNQFQSFSVFNTLPNTTKYKKKCTRVTHPSIRSKLLQKLFRAYSPKILATNITATKLPIAAKIQEKRGRYALSIRASSNQAATAISTKILKAKFFPVIYGKNIELET